MTASPLAFAGGQLPLQAVACTRMLGAIEGGDEKRSDVVLQVPHSEEELEGGL